jgi:DNA-binding CsgD family transcriptional regulator
MKSLFEWEEEWNDRLNTHTCNPTPRLLEEWEVEKQHFVKLGNHSNNTLTIIDLSSLKVDLHIGKHDKWLEHSVFNMLDQTNFKLLSDITHHDDRIFSIETELIGYEILMSLLPKERKKFWMKYNRRLKNKNGEYIFYLVTIEMFKSDEDNNPWLLNIVTERLPSNYQPEQIHYREFSHKLKKEKIDKSFFIKLSNREKEVLELAKEGFTSKQIAIQLGISHHTVKNIRKKILKKLGAANTHIAAVVAEKRKII